MKVPTYPPLIRLDPNVGELKDEEQCRQGECYNEDERQREIATQEAATFGFEDAEAREVPMQSPGRHAVELFQDCVPMITEAPRVGNARLDCRLVPMIANDPQEKAPVARTLIPTTKSSSSHPHLDDYGKEAGRG